MVTILKPNDSAETTPFKQAHQAQPQLQLSVDLFKGTWQSRHYKFNFTAMGSQLGLEVLGKSSTKQNVKGVLASTIMEGLPYYHGTVSSAKGQSAQFIRARLMENGILVINFRIDYADPWSEDIFAENTEEEDEMHAVGTKASVRVKYANKSVFAKLAYNPKFENFTIFVIVLNAIWLGIDTDLNHSNKRKSNGDLPLEPYSTIVENLFCAYFTFEILVRFLAYRVKYMVIFDAWFVFDSVLVILMILETWIMKLIAALMGGKGTDLLANFSVFRLLRLLRLTRMARLMRSVPELLTLVKGIAKAARAVIWILFFLFLVLYVFGILFTVQMMDAPRSRPSGYTKALSIVAVDSLPPGFSKLAPLFEDPNSDEVECEGDPLAGDLFGSLGDSMMSLFTRGILGDNLAETWVAIKEHSWAMQWMFFLFFALTFALLLNMLIGVLCEVVNNSAKQEEEQMNVGFLKNTIQNAFRIIDLNSDAIVSQDEWLEIKKLPQVCESFKDLGCPADRVEEHLNMMQDVFFPSMPSEPHAEPEEKVRTSSKSRVSVTRDGRKGYTIDQLMERVLEVRPGQPVSALDMEMCRATFNSNMKSFKRKIDMIEHHVETAIASDVLNIDPMASAPFGTEHIYPKGHSGEKEHTDSSLRQAAVVSKLSDVPSNILFSELQKRLAPELSPRTPEHLRLY